MFGACHRLSRKKNAGIIIRFLDLSEHDRWLAATKHLKHVTKKISLSPDLPPVIRPLKDELMQARSELAPELKRKSKMRYTPQWPFVYLHIDGQQPRKPTKTLADVVEAVTELRPLLNLRDLDLFVTP